MWDAFLAYFVQHDGRVIDDQNGTRYTTSEGQAYTLFFALVSNDRAWFEVLLRWTEEHLAGGDLTARLPGWRWGRQDSGRWALVDSNAAADADLWLAYTLFEAARLWRVPRYAVTGRALLDRIGASETIQLPGFGWMLLPAPQGFQLGPATWRLNPSYLPIHQLRYFSRRHPGAGWRDMVGNALTMLRAVAPRGFAPDWVDYDPVRGWVASPADAPIGSYDAIRVYLWAGLLHDDDPLRPALLRALGGMRDWLAAGVAVPPQRVRTDLGSATGRGPVGFSAALMPYLHALGEQGLLAQQTERLRTERAALASEVDRPASASRADPPRYYDHVLALFGQGAMEGRYAFDVHGELQTAWR